MLPSTTTAHNGPSNSALVYNLTMPTAATTVATGLRRRVCLFGTSANPPTGNQGHVGIVRAIADLKDDTNNQVVFDEIRVVPVFSHPFASKQHQMAPFEHRVAMCQLALESIATNNNAVVISEAEREIYQRKLAEQDNSTTREPAFSPPISIGTADLLEYYQNTDAVAAEYTLCLGADTFLDLMAGKWRRTEDILDIIQGRFVVLCRPMIGDTKEDDHQQRDSHLKLAIAKLEGTYGTGSIRLLRLPTLGAVSSTMVRTLSREISMGEDTNSNSETLDGEQRQNQQTEQQHAMEAQMKQMVDPNVFLYMKQQRLYGFQNT
jgi:nicotinic acid mononucleotide adenylyltransferase